MSVHSGRLRTLEHFTVFQTDFHVDVVSYFKKSAYWIVQPKMFRFLTPFSYSRRASPKS